MKISDITKRNIFDDLNANRLFKFYGRLDEIEFLKRLYNLDMLPSEDTRLKNMAEDILRHAIDFYDWPEDWWTKDTRLKLSDDTQFLRFLCEMVHPIVRNDALVVRF
jgi:hypothetical protein